MKEGAKAWRAKESAKAKEAEQKRAEEQNSESASLAAATASAEKALAEVSETVIRSARQLNSLFIPANH